MLVDLHTDFSGGMSGGLVFPFLEESSTVYCDPHSQGFGVVNKAEVDGFLELSCFSNDPVDVGNLTSGSSAFSKTSLSILKFTVHISLRPGLENSILISDDYIRNLFFIWVHLFYFHSLYLNSKFRREKIFINQSLCSTLSYIILNYY